MDACKEKKMFLANVPFDTEKLIITIYDSGHTNQVMEANWPDVLAYINNNMAADFFGRLIVPTQSP